jgi:hypothetical protein
MGTTKTKVVTTEMILAKKGLIEQAPDPFYSDLFGGDIVVENTHPSTITGILSGNTTDEIYAYSRLIYENCPLFRDKALISAYETDDPYLIPKLAYGSNVIELLQLGNYILKIYGYNETVEKIKKK